MRCECSVHGTNVCPRYQYVVQKPCSTHRRSINRGNKHGRSRADAWSKSVHWVAPELLYGRFSKAVIAASSKWGEEDGDPLITEKGQPDKRSNGLSRQNTSSRVIGRIAPAFLFYDGCRAYQVVPVAPIGFTALETLDQEQDPKWQCERMTQDRPTVW